MLYIVSNTPFDATPKTTHLKLCEVKFFAFETADVPSFDGVVFTSKNGVRAFCQQSHFRKTCAFCVGEATAKAATEAGFAEVFAGAGDAATFKCELLEQIFKNEKKEGEKPRLLLIRAQKVAFELGEFLRKNDVFVKEVVGYQNAILPHSPLLKSQKPPKNAQILFTSPLNFEAFLWHFGWEESYHAYAIGKTTARAINEHETTHATAYICQKTKLNACIEEILNLSKL